MVYNRQYGSRTTLARIDEIMVGGFPPTIVVISTYNHLIKQIRSV